MNWPREQYVLQGFVRVVSASRSREKHETKTATAVVEVEKETTCAVARLGEHPLRGGLQMDRKLVEESRKHLYMK